VLLCFLPTKYWILSLWLLWWHWILQLGLYCFFSYRPTVFAMCFYHFVVNIIFLGAYSAQLAKFEWTYCYIHLMAFFSKTTWLSGQQKGRTILDFNEPRDDGWQWHQLDVRKSFTSHSRQITMQVPHHSVFTGRMPFLLPNQSTEGK